MRICDAEEYGLPSLSVKSTPKFENRVNAIYRAHAVDISICNSMVCSAICRAVRGGAAGAALAAPLFAEKFVIIARIHSLLSGATPDLAMIEACAWPRVHTGSKHVPRVTFGYQDCVSSLLPVYS